MLVLSRRESEKILFPTLGITIDVLRIRGNKIRVGIDAPPNIPVLRHEISERKSVELTPDHDSTTLQLRDLAYTVRRRLDGAANALNELHQRMEENHDDSAQAIVTQLFHGLQALENEANNAIDWSAAAASRQILVVEDSAVERKLLAGVLELSGLAVTTAADGLEALDFLSMHARPDAVLLDMLMPRCDGPSFVREVRSNPEFDGLKIFAVSSIEPTTLGLVTGQKGIDGWFPKPLEPLELVSALDRRLSAQDATTVHAVAGDENSG